MALKATIFKVDLQIADMDRHYYHNHALTIARHPSETDVRMMVRILAFALHAHEAMEFTKGLSTDDEPDLWQKSLSGEIEVWIDIGQPDEKRIRKACGRAKHVIIYTFNHRSATVWWQQIKNKLERFKNLMVINLAEDAANSLATLAQRSMRLQCTLQDGVCWLGDDAESVQVDSVTWKHLA